MRSAAEQEIIDFYKERLDLILEDAKATNRTRSRTEQAIRKAARGYNPLDIEEYLTERKSRLDELRRE